MRERLASRLGFIMLAAGSAVGLGNVWRFPYIVGQNGGAAFVLVYLAFLALLGFPLLAAELGIGRGAGRSLAEALRELSPPAHAKWWGRIGAVLASGCFVLMIYYTDVAGWILKYAADYACARPPADPGAAFGTGLHETTRLAVRALKTAIKEKHDAGRMIRVLDVGTGSGILAIGAAMLGAGHVLAIDIDPDAVRVARENVLHNQVDTLVSVQQGNLLDRVSAICDICVANIISDVIISFAAPLMDHIRPGGLFICSGIVSSRADEVAHALTAAGYRILRRETRGEWTAFLSGRNA